MDYPFYENQTRMFYRLLNHGDMWTQGRCLDTKTQKIISQPLLKGEEEVTNWAKEQNGKGNVFVGRAARDSSGQPVLGHVLSLDIDPQRERGTAANDAQFERAVIAGRRTMGEIPTGTICSSGNGALVLYPIKTGLNKEQAERYGKALEQQARKLLSLEPVNVDATWDFSRLVKVMGTTSTKGDQSLWRHARFLDSGVRLPQRSDSILEWLGQFREQSNAASLPEVPQGSIDRSKADIALANRLKLQGFGPDDAYRSLVAYSMRPGREDDYKRIIQKVYFNKGDIGALVSGADRDVKLWTPANGREQYKQRNTGRHIDLTTGIRELDESIRGLRRAHIVTVGARTDCGKTAFAINVAVSNCRADKRVLYFSTENEYEEIWDRYAATATGISAYRIQDGTVNGLAKETLSAFEFEFTQKHAFAVYDGARPSISDVTRAIDEFKPDLVIFDYFQHFEQKDARLLAEFVMRVHEIVRERKIACLMTAMAHDRWDMIHKKPLPISMGDIKDCHTIQDESRTVLLLDWDRDSVTGDGPAAVKCIVAKNKGKRDGLVLKLDRTVPRFVEDAPL